MSMLMIVTHERRVSIELDGSAADVTTAVPLLCRGEVEAVSR
jgi:hypothetical protein